jgi:hypothetical protein
MIPKLACLSLGLLSVIIGAIDNSVMISAFGAIGIALVAVQTIVTVLSNNRTKRMEIAQAVDARNRTLAEEAADKKLADIHGLVNSQMTEQRRLLAISARTLAVSSNKPEHIILANEAERLYQEALRAQSEAEKAKAQQAGQSAK